MCVLSVVLQISITTDCHIYSREIDFVVAFVAIQTDLCGGYYFIASSPDLTAACPSLTLVSITVLATSCDALRS